MRLRIGLDIDDTVCDFINPYLKRFGTPHKDSEITRNVNRILIKDREFWLNLPVINRPDFMPALYCTKRVHSKAWSKKFLELNMQMFNLIVVHKPMLHCCWPFYNLVMIY